MYAMVLRAPRTPLALTDVADPRPGPGQVLVRVHACGVCRTDLHVVDGELPNAQDRRSIPGHEVVGEIAEIGRRCRRDSRSAIASAFPGLAIPAAYAAIAARGRRTCATPRASRGTRSMAAMPSSRSRTRAIASRFRAASAMSRSPPGCAPGSSAIGRCAWPATRRRIGLYGFGAAAHIVAQLARHQGREIAAFTRPGDSTAQAFARELGAAWAGDSDQAPPFELDAATPVCPGRDAGAGRALRPCARAEPWSAPAST